MSFFLIRFRLVIRYIGIPSTVYMLIITSNPPGFPTKIIVSQVKDGNGIFALMKLNSMSKRTIHELTSITHSMIIAQN